MFNEPQPQSQPTSSVQPAPNPIPQDKISQGELLQPKRPKNPLPLIIALVILTALGIGTSVFAFIQNSAKNAEISDLKAQLNSSSNGSNNDTDHSDDNANSTLSSQGVFLLTDALERYPYYLAVKSANPDANRQWPSNQDSFYLLNLNKLDTNDALQSFNLVEIMQPIIDNTIASSLPDSSTSATGGVTTRSQCSRFDIYYTDPRSDNNLRPLFLPTPDEYNPETEIPVNVNYSCHTDSYDVLYLRATYIININDKQVKTYNTNSNFYRQN